MTGEELLPLLRSKGRDDGFSENLVKWVKKHRSRELFAAFSAHSYIDGKEVVRLPGKTQPANVLIGFGDMDDGWLHGSRLNTILGSGASAGAFAYHCGQWQITPLANWWQGYIAGGKCFIDPEHRMYHNQERWTVNGKTRTCAWCGNWHEMQHKRRVSKTVTEWHKPETGRP